MDFIIRFINAASRPEYSVTAATFLLFGTLFHRPTRERVYTVKGGLLALAGFIAFYAVSLLNPNFYAVVAKPDNIPITIMIIVMGGGFWTSMVQAVANDKRVREGRPVYEADEDGRRKAWVWPDLVYVEFLATILMTVFLVVWAVVFKAPLEEPASPALTPNPSKAPWYFLGLQEMLVYFDPWIAGVVFPGLIIMGFIAVPYIDVGPKGNGYYTFEERKYAIAVFLYGFLVLWGMMIVIGTFFRGPNWNIFGPYEYWDIHKLEALTNVNLSEYFWVWLLGQGLPKNALVREIPGFALIGAYFVVLPGLLARTIFRDFYDKMGPTRYAIGVFLFLSMASLPIKMYMRWSPLNLKYIISIPEWFFNI